MSNGERLARIILDGRCTADHIRSGRCIGRLKLYLYSWCNQYRIACDHCGKVLKLDQVNLDPMPHIIAEEVKNHLELVVMRSGESLYDIRSRFWKIDHETKKATRSLFE